MSTLSNYPVLTRANDHAVYTIFKATWQNLHLIQIKTKKIREHVNIEWHSLDLKGNTYKEIVIESCTHPDSKSHYAATDSTTDGSFIQSHRTFIPIINWLTKDP